MPHISPSSPLIRMKHANPGFLVDILFAKKVPARKFASTIVDPLDVSDTFVADLSKEAAKSAVRSNSIAVHETV